jgi:hypothetical protein
MHALQKVARDGISRGRSEDGVYWTFRLEAPADFADLKLSSVADAMFVRGSKCQNFHAYHTLCKLNRAVTGPHGGSRLRRPSCDYVNGLGGCSSCQKFSPGSYRLAARSSSSARVLEKSHFR